MLGKIKRKLLPPSSDSFHYFEKTSHKQMNQINHKLDQVIASNNTLADNLDSANQEIARLNNKLQIVERQVYLYSTSLYNKINHLNRLH